MRNLLNIFEDIGVPSEAEIESFKSIIAGKIKQLPDDDATAKTLKEIEELLQHVQAGGRMGMINGQLHAINDPAVMAAQKRLAQYIASMEVEPKDRAELFQLWRADKILNIDKLLSKKSHSFSEIFNGYDTNPAIKELVNDIMEESFLGQGKGEFGLNVISKSVSKPGGFVSNNDDAPGDQTTKGDLLMKYNGKWRKIEIKTTHGGAARFSDQEVRPADGYEAAAMALNSYVRKIPSVASRLFPKGIPSYGVNMNKAIEFYQLIPPKNQAEFIDLVNTVITTIFGGKSADKTAVKKIVNAIKSGDNNIAIQTYAQTSFNYYMSKKDDEGVLAIDLNQKNFMFYTTAEDLTKEKLRLNANTIYLTAKDVARGAYPQLQVVKTTFGADAKAAAEKVAAKEKEKWARSNPEVPTIKRRATQAMIEQSFYDFAKDLAARRGITSKSKISEISSMAQDIVLSGYNTDSASAIRKLIKIFPELKIPKKIDQAPVQQAQPAPAPAISPSQQVAQRQQQATVNPPRQRR